MEAPYYWLSPRWIHRWPVGGLTHKGTVTRKTFSCRDVIMLHTGNCCPLFSSCKSRAPNLSIIIFNTPCFCRAYLCNVNCFLPCRVIFGYLSPDWAMSYVWLSVTWMNLSGFSILCSRYSRYNDYLYRKISNIRPTKFQNLNVSRLDLQLSLPNPLKPCFKSRMKMQLEQRRQAMSQLHLSNQQMYCLLSCVLY